LTETYSCPICDGPMRPANVQALDRLVTGEGPFGTIECERCELGLTTPQLSDEELGRYYADAYYEDFYEHSGGHGRGALTRLRDALARRAAARRYSRPPFRFEGVSHGRLLDVGCGSGELLEHFAARGWEPYGIDPSPAAAAAARRRGAKAHEGTLLDHRWQGETFEAIVFQHSLEHVVDPIAALEQALSLLAPGGVLAITVPNWSSWQRHLYRGYWFVLDLPRHQQHFSPRALTGLAEKLKLEVEEVGTSSTAIATAYSVHFLLAGRWTPGWKLWLSYALSLPLLPLVFLADRIGGGDACYVVMRNGG
jgi:2-polyprenyl-3-methyl-5-hydroxy-6-metoxy-1,4-benzoquinol methylase